MGAICTPDAREYTPYFQRYVDLAVGNDVFALLREQCDTVVNHARAWDAPTAMHRYATEKWAVIEVLGHMIEVERMLVYWAWSFARGDTARRPPLDCEAYVAEAHFTVRTPRDVADEYMATRAATLRLFQSFTPTMLQRVGDAAGGPFSTRAAIFVLAGHERHHMNVLEDRYGLSFAPTRSTLLSALG